MKWLQWSRADLENGLGGVETHARSVARELQELGVQTKFSQDPTELRSSEWDVIHTHGCGIGFTETPHRQAVWIHTLHGTTPGRMIACREWHYLGGYIASLKEISATLRCDALLTEQPLLFLYRWSKKIGKIAAVVSNGWDAAREEHSPQTVLSKDLYESLKKIQPFWLYLGRGSDPVKAVHRIHRAQSLSSEVRIAAAPGDGFEAGERTVLTGRLNSAQVQAALQLAQGLILCSRYEGFPMAVLEALGRGIPVVTTNVGGIQTLSSDLQGLFRVKAEGEAIVQAILKANQMDDGEKARKKRALHNQKFLHTWREVAEKCLEAVRQVQEMRGMHSGRSLDSISK